MEPDAVNHPSHYGGDATYEVIKVLDAWGLGFSLGNAVKYIARAGKKDPSKAAEDLKKAIFYIAHEIERLEKPKAKVYVDGQGFSEIPNIDFPKCSCATSKAQSSKAVDAKCKVVKVGIPSSEALDDLIQMLSRAIEEELG